jgi:phosphate transport system permease protein
MSENRPARPRRRRETRRSVRVAELLARSLITIGGIGTILAVCLIFFFLLSVVLPLFMGSEIGGPRSLGEVPAAGAGEPHPLEVQVDEFGLLAWTYFENGELEVRRADTGALLTRRALFEGRVPTAVAFDLEGPEVSFGFDDGEVRLGAIGFATRSLDEDELTPELAALEPGDVIPFEAGMAQRTVAGQVRVQRVAVDTGEPIRSSWQSAILRIDHTQLNSGPVFAALSAEGRLGLFVVTSRTILRTGEVTRKVREGAADYRPLEGRPPPDHLLLSGAGDAIYLVWRDGALQRFDARDSSSITLAESLDVLEEPEAEITSLAFVIGKNTLAVGDSLGRLRGWFRTKPEDAGTVDGAVLSLAHEMRSPSGAAVTAIAPSRRSRLLALGCADGSVATAYMTSGAITARAPGRMDGEVLALTLSPRQDLLLGRSPAGIWRLELDPGHPEASLGALFTKQWYEGFPGPEHSYQSSGGTDDAEPKLGLVPLVFGTLKATFYSLLFGVPVALLAAIFSSEFLSPRLRVPVKSTIEIMASLPSVVLGFLGGLVLAPFVQSLLPAVLACFFSVPLALLLGAYLWQLLPGPLMLRWSGWQRLFFVCLTLPVGILAGRLGGPVIEALLFAGDAEMWLNAHQGSGFGGWLFLSWPVCALLVVFGSGRLVGGPLRRVSASWSRARSARFDLARFLVGLALSIGLAAVLAGVLTSVGLDPRGTVVDTYVQKNALVVGFVMGFAIVPIIYTMAEDSLSSVPVHLREASLGAGATAWQTATRVIVPTAMSGLFSAVMIGLGRAVGETMIVLMATGNTAIMDWNIFSGFRTLAANIATELPEATPGDTHYRILFLAALVLFGMTFVVNTLAELVRQRFRKRAFQL